LIFLTAVCIAVVKLIVAKLSDYWVNNKEHGNVNKSHTSGGDIQHDDDDAVPHVPYRPTRYTEDVMIERSRDFYKLVNERRSVRYFSDEPVPLDVIENIVHAAGTSPSGAHTEPWTFVAVRDEDVKAKIREIIEKEEEVNYRQRMGDAWVKDLEPLNVNWIKEYLTTAPYIIIVFKQVYGTQVETGERKTHHYHEISVSIACGLLITAIQNAGLVTLTSTPLNAGTQLRDLLNRPANEKVVILCPVGYASKDCQVPNLKRKPLEDIMVVI